MLKKLLLSVLVVLVLLSIIVVAEEAPKNYELDVPYGKSVELNFNGFSEKTLQIREGSVVYFNVGELKNTFIIQEITEDSIKGKLSLMSGPFEDYELMNDVTKDTEIKLTNKIPFILIQYRLFTNTEDGEAAILKIRFPFVTNMDDLSQSPIETKITDTPQIKEDSDLSLKILLIVIIVLLIIAILVGPKALKKRKTKK